ncbi:MAG TPA: sulfatase-like hydrolase/transferase [Thermoanaerobaculia bacterium]|nr:sulfatase-like hydrolase/transferase [Thermoanaerobaculia bacterium]
MRSTRGGAALAACLCWTLVLGCAGGEPAPPTENDRRAGAPAGAPAGEVRDVVLVTVDTLRADALGFAGNPRAETPVLDRLAAAGRVFTQAHAHNVMTFPSHTNILTGRLPFEHGVRDNRGFRVPHDLPTAATLLGEAGFATGGFVGAFPLDSIYGLDRGFDVYDDDYPKGVQDAEFRLPERPGDEVVGRALAWWREHRGERRFLWIHLFDPHAPYEPPEPFASRFHDNLYLGEVAAVDAFLAPLLEPFLDGREEPALVVFTADHGESLGEHGELTHGVFAYEATLRVPLVLWGADVEPGVGGEEVRHIDLLPTILAAAGVGAPPELPGRSLLGAAPAAPEPTYFEALSTNFNRGWAPLRGVLHAGDKLIVLPIPELYDLGEDSAEARNLYDRERARARPLARLLPEESRWPPERQTTSTGDEAALRALGYLSASPPAKEVYTAAEDPKTLVAVDQEIHRFIDLYQRRRLDEATEVARGLVRDQPGMAVGHYHLAQVLLERDRPAEALAVLENALRRGLVTPEIVRQAGLLLAGAGRPAEAVTLLGPLADTGDLDTLNALGVALSASGRQQEARQALNRVFVRDPRNPVAHQHLALVALRLEDWPAARREAELAVAIAPGLHHAWNYLGVALYNLGRPAESLDAWERASELEPGDLDLLYNLGLVAAEIGDRARARAALGRFVAEASPQRHAADLQKARAALGRLEAGGR